MANVDLNELKLRYCALQKEALLSLEPSILSEAYPRWFVKAETFNVWINRIATFEVVEGEDDLGEEGAIYAYTLNSGLLVAHTTSNVAGESDALLDFVVPQVIEYIDARVHLQSEEYPEAMLYIRRASFVTGGYTQFPASVGGAAVDGAFFQWRTEFDKALEQAYF